MTSLERCPWAGSDPDYLAYHDTEWGVPLRDPRPLFELMCLEGAQAGLSWLTILRRREGYRAAFDGFDARRIAGYTDADRERLLADARIIRNRAKVASFIGNARAWLEVADPVRLLWSFVDGVPIQNRWRTMREVPTATDASRAMSTALRGLGFTFVGPTICYALMQSAGLVNDHLLDCFRHVQVRTQ